LRALLKARRRRRFVDDIAWSLWWQGFDVPEAVIRAQLRVLAQGINDDLESLAAGGGEALLDAAEAVVGTTALPDALHRVRRSLGRANFLTLLCTLGEVMVGSFSGFPEDVITGERDVAAVIERAFGSDLQGETTDEDCSMATLADELLTLSEKPLRPAVDLVDSVRSETIRAMPEYVRRMHDFVAGADVPDTAVALAATQAVLASERASDQRLAVLMCLQIEEWMNPGSDVVGGGA
jgi:hypothetical protein